MCLKINTHIKREREREREECVSDWVKREKKRDRDIVQSRLWCVFLCGVKWTEKREGKSGGERGKKREKERESRKICIRQ